jgi:hypothetical protein
MTTYAVLEEYVRSQQRAVDAGEPLVLEVRDQSTFERLTVRAVVSPPGAPAPGSDQLLLNDLAENVCASDWTIRIIEEIDPETVDIRPQSDFRKSAPDGI